MKKLVIAIVVIIFNASIMYAQQTPQLYTDSLKTINKYNAELGSVNFKLTFLYLSKSYNGLGLTTEFQYNVSDLTSLLLSINPLAKTKSSSSGSFLLNISIGSKFYFIKKKYKPYFSINAGLYKEPNIKAYFTISPAFGLDVFANKLIDVNLEAKSNLHNTGLSIGIPVLTYSFSGGINLKF